MRTRRQYWICVAVILCLQIVTMIYFGFQKQNFHVDEYFSYYSSSDNDFYIGLQDRAWNKSNITIEKCKVHMEERFNYKNVYEMKQKTFTRHCTTIFCIPYVHFSRRRF